MVRKDETGHFDLNSISGVDRANLFFMRQGAGISFGNRRGAMAGTYRVCMEGNC